MGLIGKPRKLQLIGITRETKLGQYCAKADWASAHGLQYQTKPNQEGVLVLNKQIVLEIIYISVKREKKFFKNQHKNTEAITAALRKIKYRGEQKLTQYLLTVEDMTRISTVNRFLTKLDIFSTTLGGDQYVTSSVLLPVIAAQAQAPRQSVCSAGWVSC